MNEKEHAFKIKLPANLWVKSILYMMILLIVGFVLYALNILLIPITLGVLFAFLIAPLIKKLESRDVSKNLSTAIVFSSIGILFVGLIAISAPRLVNEVKEFKKNQSVYAAVVQKRYVGMREKIEKMAPGLVKWEKLEASTMLSFDRFSAKWFKELPRMLAESFETIFMFMMIIPLVTFFVIKDGGELKKWMIHLVPNRYFELTTEVFFNINKQTGAFIRGQSIDCVLNAALVSTLLGIIGLPYFLFIGIFAGIANAIPFVGPIAAGSVGVVVALLSDTSPWPVIACFALAHVIDVMFIYPKTVGHSLNLHEIVVILGIIIGGHLGGIVGMLLIIPILGILFRSTKIMYRLLKGYHII